MEGFVKGDDVILCQIKSEARVDNYSIILNYKEFKKGKLNVPSLIRLNRLFTADKSIILYKVGFLKDSKIKDVGMEIINIFKG